MLRRRIYSQRNDQHQFGAKFAMLHSRILDGMSMCQVPLAAQPSLGHVCLVVGKAKSVQPKLERPLGLLHYKY